MNEKEIAKLLEKHIPPSLSSNDKEEVGDILQSRITKAMLAEGSRMSRLSLLLTQTSMYKMRIISVLVITLLVSSTTYTAFAADEAVPGDTLFPLDRALENARLVLSFDDERRDELKLLFAEERLDEIRIIIDEARQGNFSVASATSTSTTTPQNTTSTPQTATSTQATGLTEVEVDVFTDTTLIKIELNDQKQFLETEETDKDTIIALIASTFSISTDAINAVLSFEVEDRASRPQDTPSVSDGIDEDEQESIEHGLSFALEFLLDTKNDFVTNGNTSAAQAIDAILEGLNDSLGDLPGSIKFKLDIRSDKDRVKFKIDSDDNGGNRIKVEVRDDRVRFESRDGDEKIKIEIRNDNKLKIIFPFTDNTTSTPPTATSTQATGLTEVEVDVFTDTTLIKIELNDQKQFLETEETDKDTIIALIASTFSINTDAINAVLSFEVEDRASRPEDGPGGGTTDDTNTSDDSDDSNNDSDDSSDDDSTDENDDDSDDSGDDNSSGSPDDVSDGTELEIKAKLKDGIVEIEVRIGGTKVEYELQSESESDVINDIVNRFSLTSDRVLSVIEFDN